MNYSDWEPIYKQILSDFGYNQTEDESAANILKNLLRSKKTITTDELSELITDKQVHVFGAGPSLETDLEDHEYEGVTIAADGATSEFVKQKIKPDIIVTDLDGYMPDQIIANEQGARIIIHSHGDNIEALKRWVPKFNDRVFGTTQSQPDELNGIYNFGGFTDGDRAIYLASHFQAKRINLVAFNFSRIGESSFKFNSETKLRKLTWANLLIGMIKTPPIIFQRS